MTKEGIRRSLLGICVLIAACAQVVPPPGGPRDLDAPRLLSTKPEQRALLPKWDGPVVFSFDETIGEAGARDAVMVSPETGRPKLERKGSELRVSVEGGWKPNTIYRVIILPGTQDRFRNLRREATELVFSTGPVLNPTAVAGLATDRITGRPLADVRAVAVSFPDSVVHATVTDTAGFFGLRYLPLGRYTVRAFEDRNKNRVLDPAEKRDERSIVIGTVRDTQVVQLVLLTPDTTPARLARAEPRDSFEVRLFFDDHLDPERALTDVTVSLFQLPDSVAAGNAQLFHLRDHEAAKRIKAAADTGRVAAPTTARADTTARPTQELVLVSATPLLPQTRYRIEVHGVMNLNNVPAGGGTATFQTAARAARDSTTMRRDTGSAPLRLR